MSHVTYRIVEHDGGWAYTSDGVFSETYASHDAALGATQAVARETRVADETGMIEYQDAAGNWVTERADGHDRPEVDIED